MARKRKGQFKKGGGRVGGASRGRSRALVRTRTRTITKYRTRAMARPVRRSRRRRGFGSGGGVTPGKLVISALALGALVGSNNLIKQPHEFVQKIPGAKTFGNVAITGLGLGALAWLGMGGRFRPWLKAAGAVGVVAAAIKLGTDNTGFKFVGDEYDDDALMDVDTD